MRIFVRFYCPACLALTAILLLPSVAVAQPVETGLVLNILGNNYNIDLAAGQDNQVQLNIRNAGPTTATNIRLSADTPRGWQISFIPSTIASLEVGKNQTVEMHIKPDATAARTGYNITVIAQANETQQSQMLYVNVAEASFWLWIGGGLGLVIIGVFVFIFLRFGRQKS
jgi:uncharacterized membrane protein